ncbi:hypothetical protein, partial [Zoogloea sp.]|uniref:hypothetical protein n=1 Tax=Zoogloea sp. TaxID=49181 RepID=UPI002B600480
MKHQIQKTPLCPGPDSGAHPDANDPAIRTPQPEIANLRPGGEQDRRQIGIIRMNDPRQGHDTLKESLGWIAEQAGHAGIHAQEPRRPFSQRETEGGIRLQRGNVANHASRSSVIRCRRSAPATPAVVRDTATISPSRRQWLDTRHGGRSDP